MSATAIKSTNFKASLQSTDIDHARYAYYAYYADHLFTLAWHPGVN